MTSILDTAFQTERGSEHEKDRIGFCLAAERCPDANPELSPDDIKEILQRRYPNATIYVASESEWSQLRTIHNLGHFGRKETTVYIDGSDDIYD